MHLSFGPKHDGIVQVRLDMFHVSCSLFFLFFLFFLKGIGKGSLCSPLLVLNVIDLFGVRKRILFPPLPDATGVLPFDRVVDGFSLCIDPLQICFISDMVCSFKNF